jgi:protein-tyrosine phosphatase
MLRFAEKCGTVAMVATPHASGQYRFDAAVVAKRLAALERATSVRVYPGCDFHLQYDNIQDAIAHPDKYTINHGPYLLVEFSDVGTLHGASAMLGRLLDAGMTPVITHPERNAHIQRHLDDLASWLEDGCLAQVTAGSLTGGFGRSAQQCAQTLLRRGLVHFIASDAHDCTKRTPDLREAYNRLADERGEEQIRPLFIDNPIAVIAGEALQFAPVPSVATNRKWFQFWA